MINVIDNFLPEEVFKELQDYCYSNEFNIINAGEKQFSVLNIPEALTDYFKFEGLTPVLGFIRNAYNGFDDELRIHADNIINGEKTSIACVLYINKDEGVTDNGTCFYEHLSLGIELPKDCSNEEFDRLIREDSNDEGKWKRLDYISSRPNRLLMYSSNYFHSKYPAKIERGERIVLVCFYKDVSSDVQFGCI